MAAGLDLSASESSSPTAFNPAVPISGFATVSRATLASAAVSKKTAQRHASTQSTSSASSGTVSSTSSTASQRLSQSSASSFSMEEPIEEERQPASRAKSFVGVTSPRTPHSNLRRRSKDSDPRPGKQSLCDDPSMSAAASASQVGSTAGSSGWMDSVGKKWDQIQRSDP